VPTSIFKIKASTPSECKYQIGLTTPLVFVDASENLVMANNVVMPLNPPIAPVEEEKLEKTSLDMNVSQHPHDKEPFEKVVRIQVDCSAWDHRLSPNTHALTIYLELVIVRGTMPEKV
jgi:hypothetical protein